MIIGDVENCRLESNGALKGGKDGMRIRGWNQDPEISLFYLFRIYVSNPNLDSLFLPRLALNQSQPHLSFLFICNRLAPIIRKDTTS